MLSAEMNNILWDLQNFSHHTKAEFTNCFKSHSKYYLEQAYLLVHFLQNLANFSLYTDVFSFRYMYMQGFSQATRLRQSRTAIEIVP